MVKSLTQNWWLVVLRGVLSIVFGLATFVWPHDALTALVLVFGIYALVDGIFALATGIAGSGASTGTRWFLALGGLAGIIVGVLTFVYPNITAVSLLYLIGAWAIVTGIFEVLAAVQLRQVITDAWFYFVGGILSVVFGVLVFVYPQASALSILWLIGIYAILYGVAVVAMGLRLRSLGSTLSSVSSGTLQPSGPNS
jgi:uncharacterized membrane protein HdeD (DUF308 family)